ncbi:hypothetical protein ETH_00032720 [Eimeria tenella]|uniref:Uncharacterized protein n=1 Tax=Eimeria tenella TaxID=5802 RepID=U6L1A9_EIMTE|nr:hypothetical protein ETH_00032720 [Eimeria tenella]CDJ43946.1 hypothetical protein ETH_00032720 [Eimeria tenella]|eukprot:XP_013234695.1 hypothetical protein ETH_00032720 [Eimeria tenella]
MEDSAGPEQKGGGLDSPRRPLFFASTPKRSGQSSSSSSSSSGAAAAAAAAVAAAAASAGSAQKAHWAPTIEEIRARLKPRGPCGDGGSGVSTAAPSYEALPMSPSFLRLRLQSDGAAAAAAAPAAAASAAGSAAAASPGSSSSTAAAAAAERSLSVQREAEALHFRASGSDCLETIMRRRQTAAAAAATAAAAAAAAAPDRAAAQLDPAGQAKCLLMLHELLGELQQHSGLASLLAS